ncbi:hypothetical protein TH1_111 [Shewanella phage Thanatos-1]|nr:hypothetical protein TH1_111 [Shewanella phage Thanatos-1]
MFTKVNKSDIDMAKYNAQTNVRRTFNINMSYSNIAIMTDADVDG